MKNKIIKWSNELLDNGETHTQAQWIKILENSDWRLPTIKEYEAIDKQPKRVQNNLKEYLSYEYIITADKLKNPFTGKELPLVLEYEPCHYDSTKDIFHIIDDNEINEAMALGVKK